MRSSKKRQISTLWPLVLICLLVPLSGTLQAANNDAELKRINAIKAAFILNIARFVTWPSEVFATENAPLHLCVYRDNTYGEILEAVKGKKIGAHKMELSTIYSLQSKLQCEILLIPHTTARQFHSEFRGELQQPILTISDRTEVSKENMSREGVIVTLVRQGPRIAFEIDPWKAKEANLHMSSELLKLATIVGQGRK